MNKPVFRVVGLDQSTCGEEYRGAETSTKPIAPISLVAQNSVVSQNSVAQNSVALRSESLNRFESATRSESATVRVKLGDVLPILTASLSARLAWVQDFQDDPIVITKDLYDVLLSYQRMRNAA